MCDQSNEKRRPVDTHLVRIICEDGKLSVVPGTLYLWKGDTVWFTVKGTDALIFFPKDLEAESTTKFKVLPISSSEKWKKIKLNKKWGKGNYPYAVYSYEANDFIEVNSPPTMIIEEEP